MNWFRLALGVVAVGLIALGSWFLFRTENRLTGVGEVQYKYRWGRPYMMLADTNRDGEIDFRALYWGMDDFDVAADEYWEDRDHNRRFELHVIHDAGSILRIEIDEDEDGTYERILLGEEARTFYQHLRKE